MVTMEELKNYIPMAECEKGFLYRIHSRNLRFGVYDGNEGFIGIREKFGSLYLFTEYHWDQGPPYGTVRPLECLDKIPDNIELKTSLGVADTITGRLMVFDKPKSKGGRGWYFVDNGEVPSEDQKYNPVSISNDVLFEWLNRKEKENV